MFKQVLAAVASASLVAMVLLVTPVRAAGVTMTNFTVAAGGEHTCAIDTSGAAWCWGNNSRGQLGEGTDNPANEPQLVTGGHRFASITAGDFHTCALDTSGAAWCWGANEWFYESIPAGQLGDGTLDDANTPQPVTGGHRFTMISAGAYHTCALDTSGVAWCWGANFAYDLIPAGQLGDGTLDNANTPHRVDGGGWDGTFVSISAGGWHTCAITSAGAVYCWGFNEFGQLGNDTTTSSLANGPQLIDAGGSSGTFVSVDAGDIYTCALTSAGAAYCWGLNDDGRLGDGGWGDRDVPTAVIGGYVWAMIDAGDDHTCGVTTTGYGYCWGNNDGGELGNGTYSDDEVVPQLVSSGEQFAVVIPNGFEEGNRSCGLTPDGTLYCWGDNGDGQLGNGDNFNRNIPTLVIDGHVWMVVAGSDTSNCGTLDATVCPTITDAGAGKLISAPGSAAMSTPARYTWLNCRVAGGGTTSRPSDCRPGKTVTSTGARFSRLPYRISLADRRSGYLRLAVQVRGVTYYSGTFDVRP